MELKQVSLHTRISTDLYEKLVKKACKMGVPISWIVRKATEEYLQKNCSFKFDD